MFKKDPATEPWSVDAEGVILGKLVLKKKGRSRAQKLFELDANDLARCELACEEELDASGKRLEKTIERVVKRSQRASSSHHCTQHQRTTDQGSFC